MLSFVPFFEELNEFQMDSPSVEGNHLINYSEWSIIMVIGFVVIAMLVLLFVHKMKRIGTRRFASMNLFPAFAFVWVLGFIVYDVGMYTGDAESLFANVPMAILYSFGMFVLNSDISAIHSQFFYNWIFMFAFSMVHLAATVITLLFVIKHFGFNVLAALKTLFSSRFGAKKRETYIFWGMDSAAWHLAQSINEHHQGDKDYRMIVVRTSADSDTASTPNSMGRLFDFLSLKNVDLDGLLELECLTTNSFGDLSKIKIDNNNKDSFVDILRGQLRLKALTRIITRKTQGTAHLFFISDDEEQNIKSVVNLKNDSTINGFASSHSDHKVKFYCGARYNSVHRVIEDELLKENMEVKVIDSSHMAVERLKQTLELQPVSFVDVEDDATVSTPFNSLVIGFGEVGFDMVRYLYEFGAFVKSGSTENDVQRSPFHCHVVDNNMADRAGLFVTNAPSISLEMPFLEERRPSDALITLHDLDCRSVQFYRNLEKWISDGLNYVAICTHDDELNVSMAVRIFRLAVRYRKNMERFCILVRVQGNSNEHLHKVAEHYNRLWAAELQSTDNEKRLHQKVVADNQCVKNPIVLFGDDKETFTFNNIVSDAFVNQAKLFKERYDASMAKLYAEHKVVSWETEHRKLMQLTDEYKGFAPTLSAIFRLRRIESQTLANCFHQMTKRRLACQALGQDLYSVFQKHQLYRMPGEVSYLWKEHLEEKPDVITVLNVLAQTEHLRWNAAHEILGYRLGEHKDEARLLHDCIMPWQELSDEIKSCDYDVVDVSLGIIDLNNNRTNL